MNTDLKRDLETRKAAADVVGHLERPKVLPQQGVALQVPPGLAVPQQGGEAERRAQLGAVEAVVGEQQREDRERVRAALETDEALKERKYCVQEARWNRRPGTSLSMRRPAARHFHANARIQDCSNRS